MKKHLGVFLIAVLTLIGSVIFLPQESKAVPSFARQTGQACSACHYQSFPMLTAFGRDFKAGGYTMVGGEGLVEGEFLSLPTVLNAAVEIKTRYVKTNGDADPTTGQKTDSNAGRLDFPDEASLFAGGRVGENIGFLAEISIVEPASLANFKMPFVFPIGSARLSVIPFTSDGLGPQYGFELLNTGAIGAARGIEHGKQTSAQQFIGTTDSDVGAAEGIAFVVSHNMGYVNYTAWVPSHSPSTGINAIASYLRGVLTLQAGDWDLGGGVQWWGGTSRLDGVQDKHRAWAIDAQAQGKVGKMDLGIYLSYAVANKTNPFDVVVNAYNPGPNDRKAFAIMGQLGVIPNRVILTLGYLAGKTGAATNDSDNAFTVAAAYKVTQNVKLELDFTKFNGSAYDNSKSTDNGQINGGGNGDTKTTLLLMAGF